MKISTKNILYFLIMLYPILPVNYYIGPLNYPNCCSILIVAIYLFFQKEKRFINIFKVNFPFWLYLIIYALFAFFTSSALSGFANICSTVFVGLIIIDIIKTKNDFYKIIDLIILSSFVLSLIGIYEAFSHKYLIQGNHINIENAIRYGVARSTGPFGICINYGLYQAICALLIYYRMTMDKKNKKLKYAYILTTISVFLSVSRLGICLLIAGQSLIYFKLGTVKALKNLSIGIFIIFIVIIILNAIGLGVFELISDFFVSFMKLIGISVESNTKGVIGFGNRTDLYEWVYNSIKDNMFFGMGWKSVFEYKMTDWFTKTSIEVHYLYILYHCGIVGLIFLILSYLSTLIYFWKNRLKKDINEKISFTNILFIILSTYYICLLGVQETDLTRIYCELVVLGMAYIKINNEKCKAEKKAMDA